MQQIGTVVNGARITQAMNKAGMTATDLAIKIRTSEKNIYRWVKGQNQPTIKFLVLIAEATGQDLEFFLTGSNEDEDEEAASAVLTRDEKALRLSRYLLEVLGA